MKDLFREPILSSLDWVLGPIGLFLSIFLVFFFIDRRMKSKAERQVVWLSFGLKAFMVLFSAWIYEIYYGYGDTFGYFQCAADLNDLLWTDVSSWWNIVVSNPESYELGERYVTEHRFFRSSSTKWVNIFYSIWLIPGHASYLWLSFLSIFFSLYGLYQMSNWALPYSSRYLLTRAAFFLVPSVLFWSTGVVKEPIIFLGLGMIFHGLRVISKFHLSSLLILVGAFLIFQIKPYIILSLLVAWLLHLILSIWRSQLWRIGVLIIFMMILLGARQSAFFERQVSGWSLSLLEERLMELQESQIENTERYSGSGYVIYGWDDASPLVVARAGGEAFLTGLLRPFIWEAKKPINLLSAGENLVISILLLSLLWKSLRSGVEWSYAAPQVILIWIVIFLVIVGLTSFNFGTLTRYRCIVMPFVAWSLLTSIFDDTDHSS